MSSSLLRGLRVLEMLAEEPLGVSEVARRLDVDKAGVSRMLTALLREGWVRRTGSRYALAERTLHLQRDSRPLLERAGDLARALHEQTGLDCVVLRLAGTAAQPLAIEAGRSGFLDPEAPFEHLWATAGGVALLAQVGEDELGARLEAAELHRGTAEAERVRDLVHAARLTGIVEERGWSRPGSGCLAVPWRTPDADAPLAVALIGPLDDLDAPAVTTCLLSMTDPAGPAPSSRAVLPSESDHSP